MASRGIFGWSPPHVQPLTPVSEVSEPPESPSPYVDPSADGGTGGLDDEQGPSGADDDMDESEPPPATVPFKQLFRFADRFDWLLMLVGGVAAAAHGMALVVYLHFFGTTINLLHHRESLYHNIKEVSVFDLVLLYNHVCFVEKKEN
jgi:ATP-binding cassette, subfamily B (MDR/TAP), member 1